GRARTMLMTILLYSICTGLSAMSRSFWDFAVYRFLTGLGVGGEFAVGVALVAEVMPDHSRTGALGLLQALSAVGNITAALISLVLTKSFKAQGLPEAQIAAKVGEWRSMGMLVLQVGAFLGMLTSSAVAAVLGRKKTFVLALTSAMLATAGTFHFFTTPSQL